MPAAVAAKKVLVVDDEAHVREILARRLADQGLQVTERPDGEEGLEAMNHEVFDCILLDLKMPRKDGVTVLRERIGTLNENTPIVVLTSMPAAFDTEWAKQCGANRVLSKSETSMTKVVETVSKEAMGG